MKKYVLIAFLCFCGFSAWADRCVLNTPDVTQLAVSQLLDIDRVVFYCPTCCGDNRVRYITVANLEVLQEGEEQIIKIGDENIDFAYIYLPTKKTDIYRNLGYIVNCADLEYSPVLEYLNVKHPYGIENIEYLLRRVEQCLSDDCVVAIYKDILQDYFVPESNELKGFSFEKIILPDVISKDNVVNLLGDIARYYGERNF